MTTKVLAILPSKILYGKSQRLNIEAYNLIRSKGAEFSLLINKNADAFNRKNK